jgi:hypothetical protein
MSGSSHHAIADVKGISSFDTSERGTRQAIRCANCCGMATHFAQRAPWGITRPLCALVLCRIPWRIGNGRRPVFTAIRGAHHSESHDYDDEDDHDEPRGERSREKARRVSDSCRAWQAVDSAPCGRARYRISRSTIAGDIVLRRSLEMLYRALSGSSPGRDRVAAMQAFPDIGPLGAQRAARLHAHLMSSRASEQAPCHGEARSAKPEASRGIPSALRSDDEIARALLLRGIPRLVARLAAPSSLGMTA